MSNTPPLQRLIAATFTPLNTDGPVNAASE